MLADGVRVVRFFWAKPVLAVILVQLPVFAILAMLRTVDGDEGDYMLAARQVFEGRLPYVDFLYTQTPLLPYAYGLWMKLFGLNWYAARLLSAVFATALGTLIYVYAARAFKNQSLALVGLFLFATSAFTLAWDTVVMTYALSALLLFSAFTVLTTGPRIPRISRFILSGFLLAMSVDTRLLILAAAPAFIIGLYRCNAGTESRLRRVSLWLLGFTVGLAPVLFFIVVDLDAFFFGNLGYHAVRNAAGELVGDWAQKAAMLAELLNLRSAGGETITFQVPLLLALNAYYIVLVARHRAHLNIPLLASMFLAIALLLPTPTYAQYFVVLLPFVIINGVHAIDVLRHDAGEFSSSALRDHFRTALGVFLAGYALVVPVVIYKYVSWLGPTVPGLYKVDPHDWSLPAIRAVSGAIERSNPPGEQVLAFWPGYLVETHAAPVTGMDNTSWLMISSDVATSRQRPKIASQQSVDMALAQHQPNVAVLGVLTPDRYRDLVLADGYALAENVRGVELLKRPT
jgi:4-amino-4-deoxy-L-arabinose transferase-like glycosyltransferase